jgi:hypothetical protein
MQFTRSTIGSFYLNKKRVEDTWHRTGAKNAEVLGAEPETRRCEEEQPLFKKSDWQLFYLIHFKCIIL